MSRGNIFREISGNDGGFGGRNRSVLVFVTRRNDGLPGEVRCVLGVGADVGDRSMRVR